MMRLLIVIKLISILCIFIIPTDLHSQENTIQFSAPADETFFILPIPNNKMPLHSKISIDIEGKSLEHESSVLTLWYNHNKNEFIRLLTIKLEGSNNHSNTKIINYGLKWVPTNRSLGLKKLNIASSPFLISPSKQWLAQSILLQPKINKLDTHWYTKPQSLYANFVTNEALLNEKGYPKNKFSQWLFDRPRAIYQLYILTEDPKWLKEGTKLTKYYLANIDDTGQFKLKDSYDLKYLMPNGLLYYYLLTGDKEVISVLKTFYDRALSWDPTYDGGHRFWTERHQAAALNIAIAYWEVTGSLEAKNRIDEIIEATVQMVFNPRENWPLRGCPQHTYKSHEGKAGDSPVCSPWMMALLSDGLWRYYRLSEDKKSAALLNAFGDFMPHYGIHFADDRLKNMVLPLYLSSMDNKRLQIKDQWTDRQHACDVASLIGKSLYIKKKTTEDTYILQELFSVFVQQCKDINKKYRNKKHDYLPMLPPRRFGWTYSTTSDLPWLESWLNSHGTQ
jgi:hypothetical protein